MKSIINQILSNKYSLFIKIFLETFQNFVHFIKKTSILCGTLNHSLNLMICSFLSGTYSCYVFLVCMPFPMLQKLAFDVRSNAISHFHIKYFVQQNCIIQLQFASWTEKQLLQLAKLLGDVWKESEIYIWIGQWIMAYILEKYFHSRQTLIWKCNFL